MHSAESSSETTSIVDSSTKTDNVLKKLRSRGISSDSQNCSFVLWEAVSEDSDSNPRNILPKTRGFFVPKNSSRGTKKSALRLVTAKSYPLFYSHSLSPQSSRRIGQWSEPITSGNISAFTILCESAFDTKK